MRKGKHIMRAVMAWILSVLLLSGTVFGDETESGGQTVNPGQMLSTLMDQVSQKTDQVTVPDFEGSILVTASEGMRTAIADHYRSEDDMSWIQSAQILLSGASNETNGVNLDAAFFFNDTELYHLQVSYDRKRNIIYLVCPELKEEVLAFPVGDFSADAQTITGRKVTPEMIADYTTALKELNDLISSISLEMLQKELLRYAAVLSRYVRVETGIATITAGSLSEEGHTTTYSLDEEALRELIPEVLHLMAKDEFLERILESPFAQHAFRLFVKNKALKLMAPGALWTLAQQFMLQAAEKDYSWGREFSLTYALDRNKRPVSLSAALNQGGIHAELFRLNLITDGSDHAVEGTVGPVLARRIGFKTKMSSGLLVQGSLKDDILRETVSVSVNGNQFPVLRIRDLDLLEFRNLWPRGALDLFVKNLEYTCEFYTDEDGVRSMRFLVNGVEWFVLTVDLKEVEEADLEEMDLSEAFTVDSRKAFFKYMRDGSAIRMFEKLSSAGVPQEYVDMLTDGEAATESSRENTEELE